MKKQRSKEGLEISELLKHEQSLYSKENLYNLDSDDDELDFLRKHVDFKERAEVRKEYKDDRKMELKKNYDRKYPLKHFENKYPVIA